MTRKPLPALESGALRAALERIAVAVPDEDEGVRPLDDLLDRVQAEAREALRAARELPALESGAELHHYVRQSKPSKGLLRPPAFTEAVERVETLEEALQAARGDLQGLVRDAYALGVEPSTLARWSGYTHGWVRRLVA